MPRYDYVCLDCLERLRDLGVESPHEGAIFETSHSMNPTEKELLAARECPRCDRCNTERIPCSGITTYVRGYGILDRVGANRDMNVYKITTEDPYSEMRAPGEVDDMKHKLRAGGKHDKKPVHFVPKEAPPATT